MYWISALSCLKIPWIINEDPVEMRAFKHCGVLCQEPRDDYHYLLSVQFHNHVAVQADCMYKYWATCNSCIVCLWTTICREPIAADVTVRAWQPPTTINAKMMWILNKPRRHSNSASQVKPVNRLSNSSDMAHFTTREELLKSGEVDPEFREVSSPLAISSLFILDLFQSMLHNLMCYPI